MPKIFFSLINGLFQLCLNDITHGNREEEENKKVSRGPGPIGAIA